MSHYRHVKICIHSRCQGNELEICNLFQFIILSHKPWLNAIVESCLQLKLKRWSWKWKTFFKMDVVPLMAKTEVPVLCNFPKHSSLRICAIAWNYHMANLTWSFWPTSKHLLTWKSLEKNESEVSGVFYFSGQTNLQRNVSSVVWNKLFSILLAKRPLWRQWNIATSSWKSLTTSTQCHITNGQWRGDKLRGRKCCSSPKQDSRF